MLQGFGLAVESPADRALPLYPFDVVVERRFDRGRPDAVWSSDIMPACRSIGATGICWDNSGAESLRSTFKHEYYYRHVFATESELVAAVNKWMHFDNNQRRHSVIGMLSAIAYEHSLNAAAQAA